MSENYDLLISFRWRYSCLKNGNVWSSKKGDVFIVPEFNLLSSIERDSVYGDVLKTNKIICEKLDNFIKEQELDISMDCFPEVEFTPLNFCELVKLEVERKKEGLPLLKRIRGDMQNQWPFKLDCQKTMNETIGKAVDKQFDDLTKKPAKSFAESKLDVLPKQEKENVL